MLAVMTSDHSELFFAPRFCGPPGTVNGGFAAGTLAELCGGAAEVTLRRPVPVDRALTVQHADHSRLTLLDGDTVLAEARPAPAAADATAPEVSAETARAVAGRAPYFADPAFPRCFVCGPDRAVDDGLRIFPGPVPGGAVWAAPWTPDPSLAAADGKVRPEIVWAALDCPSGIAAGESAGLPDGTIALLGRMTASVVARPRPGQECRVVAWPLGRDGRKLAAATALLGPDGAVLATARTLWLTVSRAALRDVAGATS